MTEYRRGDHVTFTTGGRETHGTIVDRNYCGCWIIEADGEQYEATSEQLRLA